MNKKNIVALLALFLTIIGVGGGVLLVKRQQEWRLRAAPSTTIYFDPVIKTAAVDRTVDFDILVDTGTNFLATMRLDITYDSTTLQALSLTFNPALLPQPLRAVDLSQPGKITGSSGVAPGSPISGASQKIASVSFKTLAEAPSGTKIEFGADTSAYSATQDEPMGTNLIVSKNPATVIIESAVTPTPSPSPSPTPMPSPSPSPSPGQGGGGDATPTPTPTPLPSPRPSPGTGGGGTTTSPSPSPSPLPEEIPVTGIITPTTLLLTTGGVFLLLGLLTFLL